MPFHGLADEIRSVTKTMRRNWRFSFLVVTLLALGIGASSAVFTVLEALIFRQLPVKNPGELIQLEQVYPNNAQNFFSTAKFQYLRDHAQSFRAVFAWSKRSAELKIKGHAAPVAINYVSGNYYASLGVPARMGRAIGQEDDQAAAPPVAVISYSSWQGKFARDPEIIGQIVSLNSVPTTIVGVDPPWFSGTEVGGRFDLTLPLSMQSLVNPKLPLATRPVQWLRVMARLKENSSAEQAQRELAILWPNALADLDPQGQKYGVWIRALPAGNGLSQLRQQFSKPLYILAAVTGLVLLIVCGNLMILLLARGYERYPELTIRLALGATSKRVRRQLLVESSFLAFLGGLSGVALAMFGSQGLLMLLKLNYPGIYLDIGMDSHIIGFIALTTLGAGIIFGVAPAFFTSRIELGPNLRSNAITLKGTETRIGRVLVSAEVALCFVLLAGAGLIGRSLRNLLMIAPGFNPAGVTMIDMDATRTGYKGPALAELHANLLQNLASLPGVKSASLSTVPPLTGGGGVVYEANTVSIDGGPVQEELHGHLFENSVSAGFFNTLEIPLIAGRDFDSRDHEAGSSVVIVSEQFARTFFGHGDTLGHRISIDSALTGEIIGIAKDSRYENLREQPALVIYRAYRQDIDSLGHVYFEVRGQSTPADFSAAMRRELGPLAGSVSISPIPLVAWLNLFLVPERVLSILLSSFALIALILALTGLYAIISHFVTRRRGEIAVRIMLGARRGAILWLVVKNVLLVFSCGLLTGGLAALLGRRLLSSLLYGLARIDLFTFVAVPLLLLGIGMLATYLPMRRAVHTDPNVALRYE